MSPPPVWLLLVMTLAEPKDKAKTESTPMDGEPVIKPPPPTLSDEAHKPSQQKPNQHG